MSNLTLREIINQGKPAKPYEDFPLFAHASGRWAKKIRGQLHYFGRWDEPDAALQLYQEQRDCLHAGRTPKPDVANLTVKDLCNHFLAHKQSRVDTQELSPLTFADYKTACDEVVATFGKQRLVDDLGPLDFALLRNRWGGKWGLYRILKMVRCVHSLFKYSIDARLCLNTISFGPSFAAPKKSAFRRAKAETGRRDLPRQTILDILKDASPILRACVLLGVNGGLGNADCGNLQIQHLDMARGMADFPRLKTGIQRRFALWPETVDAIEEVLSARRRVSKILPTEFAFRTKSGGQWNRNGAGKMLSELFRRALKSASPESAKRIGFYSLRRTFRSVADRVNDQPALYLAMGHDDGSMAATYRQWIDDERLRKIADAVRTWLFGTATGSNPYQPVAAACPEYPDSVRTGELAGMPAMNPPK